MANSNSPADQWGERQRKLAKERTELALGALERERRMFSDAEFDAILWLVNGKSLIKETP